MLDDDVAAVGGRVTEAVLSLIWVWGVGAHARAATALRAAACG